MKKNEKNIKLYTLKKYIKKNMKKKIYKKKEE